MINLNFIRTKIGDAFLKLTFGTLGAQIIQVLTIPLVLKFYTPEEFGLYAVYSAVLSVMVVISTGRYEMAVMVPRSRDEARDLVVLSCMAVALFTSIVFWIGYIVNSIYSIPIEYQIFLWSIPINIFFMGINQSFQYWFNRNNNFKIISQLRILYAFFNAAGLLLCGYYSIQQGLILSAIVASLVNVIVILYLFSSNKYKISFKQMYHLMIIYKNYPLKSSVGAFLNSFSYSIESFLFPIMFGLYSTGNYFFAGRILNTIKTYTSSNIWQVFISQVTGKCNKEILNCMNKYQEKLMIYLTIPMFSFIIFIGCIWPIVFDQKWHDALAYFFVISGFIYSNIIVASFSLFLLLNRPDAEMCFNLGMFTIKLIFIIMAYLCHLELLATVLGITVLQSFLFLLLGSWNYWQLMGDEYYFLKKCFHIGKLMMPFVLILCSVFLYSSNIFVIIITLILINLIYFSLLRKRACKSDG